MRRLTAALVLLALLLTGCVWSRRSVEKVCTEAAEALYAGELDRARAIWEEAQPLLGALLPHEEIDETGLLFERLAAAHDGTDDENLQHTVKPAEKTALFGRPCVAKMPERWYALVRGD